MNKTQKTAWALLMIGLFGIVLGVYIGLEIFVMRRLPGSSNVIRVLLIFYILLTGVLLVWSIRKQSRAEVDSDERDKFIEKRAVLASVISVWILLAAETIIPRFIVGLDGAIPVWMLAIMHMVVMVIAMMVYCIAILIQYSRGGKDGE